ncbi:hypothetical protein JHK85_053080 [Glycine max]|nr:hypothetical protein JHK85_053080 [Glycine max]
MEFLYNHFKKANNSRETKTCSIFETWPCVISNLDLDPLPLKSHFDTISTSRPYQPIV